MIGNKVVCGLLLAGLVAIARANDSSNNKNSDDDTFLNDIEALSQQDIGDIEMFDEQTPGFDLRDDKFYFQDNLVDELFKRNKFLHGLITLGGQQSDAVNIRAKQSSFPFAVAQRAAGNSLGTVADRWDAKDVGHGQNVEFFAVYHGNGKNDFVVNKVRAHLLRRLANVVQEWVPMLTRAAQPDANKHTTEVEQLHEQVRAEIEHIFADIDQSIRLAMHDSDDSWASATVAIVTPANIITASVGPGQILGYDNSSSIHKLTNYFNDVELKNVFGAKRGRQAPGSLRPHVHIFDRSTVGIQLMVLESPLVSQNIRDYDLFRIVLSEINQHKDKAANEQQIYSSSVGRILQVTSRQGNWFSRYFNPDHTVMLIGLERDYAKIH